MKPLVMSTVNKIACLFLLLCLCGPAVAGGDSLQQGASGNKDVKAFFDKLEKRKTAGESKTDVKKLFDELLVSDQTYREYSNKFLEYEAFSLDHRRRVFNWQYYSSIVIFCIVILIVLTGLLMSYQHFRHSMKTHDQAETEISLGKTGIKVRSSIIGIIILVISVAFFYLYLAHVYEIEEVGYGRVEQEVLREAR